MKRARWIRGLGFGMLLGVYGCEAGMPMRVECAFGPGAKYDASDTTFDWSPEALASVADARARNPNLHDLIVELTESELVAKGYSRRTDGQADLFVGYGVYRRDTADPWTMEPLTEGTLGLTLNEPETGKLIYRGTATITVDESADPERRKATLREAIRRILEKYPARKT